MYMYTCLFINKCLLVLRRGNWSSSLGDDQLCTLVIYFTSSFGFLHNNLVIRCICTHVYAYILKWWTYILKATTCLKLTCISPTKYTGGVKIMM